MILHGDCLEKGTKLIAIDPCEMDYGTFANVKALIVGKEYTVLRTETNDDKEDYIVIQSEIANEHYFFIPEIKEVFTFPENNTDNRL